MKIGVFSDIHGNIYSLEKVWKELKAESCDLHFFLGDICGYYYRQNEVISLLKRIPNLISVLGNHDDFFLRILEDRKLEQKYVNEYGKSCSFLKRTLKKENLDFIKSLKKKYIIDDLGIALFHGSPFNFLNEYVYPENISKKNEFRSLPYKVIFLGHTHYPMDAHLGKVRIINPGSCGQPRDFSSASFAVFDYKIDQIRFKRVAYDTSALIKEVFKHKEDNPYLVEVLRR